VPIMKISKHDPVTKSLEVIAGKLVESHDAKQSGWISKLFG